MTGGNLNAVSRQALMQKLARVPDTQIVLPVSAYVCPLHLSLVRLSFFPVRKLISSLKRLAVFY